LCVIVQHDSSCRVLLPPPPLLLLLDAIRATVFTKDTTTNLPPQSGRVEGSGVILSTFALARFPIQFFTVAISPRPKKIRLFLIVRTVCVVFFPPSRSSSADRVDPETRPRTRPQLEKEETLSRRFLFCFYFLFPFFRFDIRLDDFSCLVCRLSSLFIRVLCPFTPIRLIVANRKYINCVCRILQSVEPIRVHQCHKPLPTIDRDSIGRQKTFLLIFFLIISHITHSSSRETKVSTWSHYRRQWEPQRDVI
jgi:hypothetical protein